jgi:hypothetical protein
MRKEYEGMEATNEAQLQFERDHSGHPGFQPTTGIDSTNVIFVTRCLACPTADGRDQEFREFPAGPVTSN